MSAETKTSKGTKIFTFVYVLLLIVLLIFASIYVAMAPDFVKPNNSGSGGDTDATIWEYNMDDLFAYFEEHGVMKKADRTPMTTIGTENWICNGVDM
ncbi:MAG: hypothetical protein ACI4U2_03275, partial [Christensenellaceae bacterium]